MASPALLLICVCLIILVPFIPALHEWLYPTDVAPLPVRRNEVHHLRYFADSFHHSVSNIPSLDWSKLRDLHTKIPMDFSDHLTIVHQDIDTNADYCPETVRMLSKKNCIVIFVHDARLAPGSHTMADLFAAENLSVGAGASLRACSAQGMIMLGVDTVVHRWIDASCIHVGSNASIDGRITATKDIIFSGNSHFVRAGAPSMHFGRMGSTTAMAPEAPIGRSRHLLADGMEQSLDRHQEGDFVVRGAYRVRPDTTVLGSIKTYGDLYLGERAQIAGSLVSNQNIVFAGGCSVRGPVISQNHIVLGPNCRIGTPDAATTMICRTLTIAAGCLVHGVITTQDGATVVLESEKYVA